MGDFSIHRLRIGSWVPSPIKSIAADPSSYQLAVGEDLPTIALTHAVL